MKITLSSFLIICSLVANGQERSPEQYLKYLVPIYAPIPIAGANGSLWQSLIFLRNDGSQPLDVFPLSSDCISSIACFGSARPYPAFGPMQSGYHVMPAVAPFHLGTPRPSGTFLYVERGVADQLTVSLTIGDINKSPVNSARLPVVPEAGFFSTTRSVIGVPIEPETRVGLRIYSLEPRHQARVKVRIFETFPRLQSNPPGVEGPHLLAEGEYAFQYDEAEDRCGFTFRCDQTLGYVPGIVQIGNLLEAFPQIAGTADPSHRVRIEIEPLTEGTRFWPLVTVTNDGNGYVSVYTVQ